MCRRQAPRRLEHEVGPVVDRERPPFLDDGRQVAPLDVLHNQQVHAVGVVGVERGDDVGMIEPGGSRDFALEAGDDSGILHQGRRKHFDSHDAMHPAMLGLEHLPHAAGADLVEDRVVPEDERFSLAPVNFVGLEPGQLFLADKLPCELFSVLGVALGGG